MQELRLSALKAADGLLHSIPRFVRSLFTPRRLAYSLASALLFTGVASIQTNATDQRPNDATAENLTKPGDGSSSASVQLNGQDIPLPANGTHEQTVVEGATTTTIRTSSSTSGSGITVNVQSTTAGNTAN